MDSDFEIFLVAPPGLEPVLADEARAAGFAMPTVQPGGVATQGGWPEVWRANLCLRGATRVLVRLGAFRAFHLAQLDKRARKFPWADVLRPDVAVRVEVSTSKKSKIYHAGAAAQRIERAITETLGAPIAADAPVTLKVRIDDNLVTISVDSSGDSLHKRGHKQAMGKAPMRETLASVFLRQLGFDGSQTVVDPMCGSGTFPIEAAEQALGLYPGRARGFSFQHLAGFDAVAWQALLAGAPQPKPQPQLRFFGYDRDAGAVRMAQENAQRAGVADSTSFVCQPLSALLPPPDTAPGIVVINPPYGDRIGNKKLLFGLYGAIGTVLGQHFAGWRLGIITTDGGLARATGLDLQAGPPVPHGGLKVRLYQADL
ncbi:MAG: class I SAM-dependent RNA methyltransferase [Rhodobacteraceae bacterium]|jgi:putative N6-adenine-specific DNA methylase|nr:class I SAM-dependent RNA methyltransferase [Paracoccaceae bacterium]